MTDSSRSNRRTDEIRRRRSRQSQKTKQSTRRTRRKYTAPTTPPVMVRNSGVTSASMSGVRLKDKPSRRVKRRYDVALNMPGAEMRLPAIPQIRMGWRFASFVMAGFTGGWPFVSIIFIPLELNKKSTHAIARSLRGKFFGIVIPYTIGLPFFSNFSPGSLPAISTFACP